MITYENTQIYVNSDESTSSYSSEEHDINNSSDQILSESSLDDDNSDISSCKSCTHTESSNFHISIDTPISSNESEAQSVYDENSESNDEDCTYDCTYDVNNEDECCSNSDNFMDANIEDNEMEELSQNSDIATNYDTDVTEESLYGSVEIPQFQDMENVESDISTSSDESTSEEYNEEIYLPLDTNIKQPISSATIPSSVKGVSCGVCLEDHQDILQQANNAMMSTICGHVFCRICILTAFSQGKICPMCRSKLKRSQIHLLHL